jgi:hypothetical protein
VGLNGKLYVAGGFVEGWTPTDEVHEYDRARPPPARRGQGGEPPPAIARRVRQDPRGRRYRRSALNTAAANSG